MIVKTRQETTKEERAKKRPGKKIKRGQKKKGRN